MAGSRRWRVVLVGMALLSAAGSALRGEDWSTVRPVGDYGSCTAVLIGPGVLLTAGHCPTADCRKPKGPSCSIRGVNSHDSEVRDCRKHPVRDLAVCRIGKGKGSFPGPFETVSPAGIPSIGTGLRVRGQMMDAAVRTLDDPATDCFFVEAVDGDARCPFNPGDSGGAALWRNEPDPGRRLLYGLLSGPSYQRWEGICAGSKASQGACRITAIDAPVVVWLRAWAKQESLKICGVNLDSPQLCRGG